MAWCPSVDKDFSEGLEWVQQFVERKTPPPSPFLSVYFFVSIFFDVLCTCAPQGPCPRALLRHHLSLHSGKHHVSATATRVLTTTLSLRKHTKTLQWISIAVNKESMHMVIRIVQSWSSRPPETGGLQDMKLGGGYDLQRWGP